MSEHGGNKILINKLINKILKLASFPGLLKNGLGNEANLLADIAHLQTAYNTMNICSIVSHCKGWRTRFSCDVFTVSITDTDSDHQS